MRNKRSFLENQKEEYIKKLYKENSGNFLLPRARHIDSLEEVKDDSSFLNWKDTKILHGKGSSAVKSAETREKLYSNLETISNLISGIEEKMFNNHRSYINSFVSLEKKIKKIEADANRDILLALRDDPFSYGITDNFNSREHLDEVRSDTELTQGKIFLKSVSNSERKLKARKITSRVTSSDGALSNVKEINNNRNILQKDGSFFKIIAESSSRKSLIELEITIELENEESIDRLKILSKPIERSHKESVSLLYSKNGKSFISLDPERVDNKGNIFDIQDTDIKVLKVKFYKLGPDLTANLKNEYLFAIDYIGIVDYVFDTSSTAYLGPYPIVDEDENPIDFSLATIETGTCCVTPNETSISFYLSKDGQNYIPIGYFGESNTVVEFKNTINTAIFSMVEPATDSDVVKRGSDYVLNNFIPSQIDFVRGSLSIKKGVGKWAQAGNVYSSLVEIANIEGAYFDLKETECKINGVDRSGLVFLSQGYHKISTTRYKEIPKHMNSLADIKAVDDYYPTNHKYLFEGYKYSQSYTEEKVYVGADNLYKTELLESDSKEDLVGKYYILEDSGDVFFVVEQNSQDEFYIECKINENITDNKVYIKAILKSDNPYKSPRIDSVQVRVV